MSLSVLRRASSIVSSCPLRSNLINIPVTIPKRFSHHEFEIKPTEWALRKARSVWHYCFKITFLFYGSIILYANVFVGPATLAEIPEGYTPKHWEYYRHPISRWLQRYCYRDPQEMYEAFLAKLYDEHVHYCLKQLDQKVEKLMRERKDYQAYVMRPVSSDYYDYARQFEAESVAQVGEIDVGL